MHVRRVRGAADGARGERTREVEREVACEVEGDAGREAARAERLVTLVSRPKSLDRNREQSVTEAEG